MARLARIIAPGHPHHIVQESTHASLFDHEEFAECYLRSLAAFARQGGLQILAYNLVRSRVHLVAIPRTEESLSGTLRRLHSTCSRASLLPSRRSDRPLWESRFQSCALDKDWLWVAVKNVERQAVAERLVRRAENWPLSSAAVRCGWAGNQILATRWPDAEELEGWCEWLSEPEVPSDVEALMQATRRGYPLGADGFMTRLERRLKRAVRPRPVGRPRNGLT